VSPLDDQLGDYLRIRRALGYKLARTEKLLAQYIAFLEERDERDHDREHARVGDAAWRQRQLAGAPALGGARVRRLPARAR
jgi:hypothetical protein